MKARARWAPVMILLLCLLLSGAAAEEPFHKVTLRGTWETGNDVTRTEKTVITVPVTCRDAEGKTYNLAEMARGGQIQIETAAMRFCVTDQLGRKVKYSVTAPGGETQSAIARTGWNMRDIGDVFRAGLSQAEGEEISFTFSAKDAKRKQFLRPDAEKSVLVTVTFTGENLPLFPEDRVSGTDTLDAAVSMLEEGNLFLEMYDETGDSLAEARYELGVPYYFGGKNPEKILKPYHPLQTTNYYKAERIYLCGFDCKGFIQWVQAEAGVGIMPGIDDMLAQNADCFFLSKRDVSLWGRYFRPGDLIAIDHGMKHVMMFLGTLRSLGIPEGDVPEVAGLYDAPLFIHCGSNLFYYDRYLPWIKEQGYTQVYPPDGGVTVSVAMPDLSLAQETGKAVWGQSFGWFDIGGESLLIFPLDNCNELAWYMTD